MPLIERLEITYVKFNYEFVVLLIWIKYIIGMIIQIQ